MTPRNKNRHYVSSSFKFMVANTVQPIFSPSRSSAASAAHC
jgi:hypothetical protein